MELKKPDSMNTVVSKVLRYGVVLSAVVITFGTVLLAAVDGLEVTEAYTTYYPDQVPHGNFDVSLAGLSNGLLLLDPFSIIELGVFILLATPVARVLFSIFLFVAEGDRTYVYITSAVLILLLFSMLFTPFIPGFNH
jgi:uncharacterized membrane protein